MAESDWTAFTTNALDDGSVAKGVTNAFSAPSGGGAFVCAFNSLNTDIGFAGWYYNASGFNPIATGKGGSVRVAMRRYAAGTLYAPMAGFITGNNVASATAYTIGLSDSDPYQIVLKKGLVGGGLDPTAADVIRVSDQSWTVNTLWFHLRLDVIVNPQGDVVLNVYRNDLDSNDVTAPVWEAVSGMASFVDDSTGILTDTAPLISGFRGFFGHFNNGESGKVSMFDQLELYRQIAP